MISGYTITGIAATNQQNILGIDGDMPWGKIKHDLMFYKSMTQGKTLICGGNTFRSLPPVAIKNRQIFVLSRQKFDYLPDNVKQIENFYCPGFIIEEMVGQTISNEIMVVGGGLVYQLFEDQYDKFYMTEIVGKDFDVENKNVVYFEADLEKRSLALNWKKKQINAFKESNNVGDFDVKIFELS